MVIDSKKTWHVGQITRMTEKNRTPIDYMHPVSLSYERVDNPELFVTCEWYVRIHPGPNQQVFVPTVSRR